MNETINKQIKSWTNFYRLKNNIVVLSIIKRNFFVRAFSIKHYKVLVIIDGKIKQFNCWASVRSPTLDSLVWWLIRQINRRKIK